MAETAEINSRNFIQKIKGMENAERKRLKLADILKWIVDFDEDATQKSMANDIALLFTNFKLLSATVASNEKEMTDMKAKNVQLQEELETLKREGTVGEGNAELTDLKNRINEIDQYLRINNLEIVGLPDPINTDDHKETEENLVLNAINTLQDLPNPVRAEDIDISHPLKTNRRDQKNVYVVKFISRKTKANILAAKRTLNNRNFKFRGNDVFFNEHLSPTNRSLFATANEKKRTLGYKHLWTRGGTILMRKDDESEVFTITSEQDFENIV